MEKKTEGGKGIDSELPSMIFMGTPDFAVPALRKLASAGAPILMVVTQPDRPKGRGKKLTPSPVKVLAEQLSLPVYQPERVREAGALERLRSCKAECAVVVAYGQILPQAFLDAYPLGALNVHASLLPRYRGAAPIQRSLLAGDTSTGVSIMLLDAGMDTGPVLAMREIPMGEDETFGALHGRLAELGAELLFETLKGWRAGRIHPVAQEESGVTYAPPLRKEELRLNWHLSARQIVNTIRAFDPVPGAFGFFGGKRVKCFSASLSHWKGEGEAGEVVGHSETGLVVLAGDRQAFRVGELQLEGQRRLTAAELLRGHPLPPGSRLE